VTAIATDSVLDEAILCVDVAEVCSVTIGAGVVGTGGGGVDGGGGGGGVDGGVFGGRGGEVE
jgi:hypothetical protein